MTTKLLVAFACCLCRNFATAQQPVVFATQAQVDAGTSKDSVVSPYTLANSSLIATGSITASAVSNIVSGMTQTSTNPVAYNSFTVQTAGGNVTISNGTVIVPLAAIATHFINASLGNSASGVFLASGAIAVTNVNGVQGSEYRWQKFAWKNTNAVTHVFMSNMVAPAKLCGPAAANCNTNGLDLSPGETGFMFIEAFGTSLTNWWNWKTQ